MPPCAKVILSSQTDDDVEWALGHMAERVASSHAIEAIEAKIGGVFLSFLNQILELRGCVLFANYLVEILGLRIPCDQSQVRAAQGNIPVLADIHRRECRGEVLQCDCAVNQSGERAVGQVDPTCKNE